jgi:hypothetical protein
MAMNNFHAGRVFEPLPGDKTRVKTYADGGSLISDEEMPSAEAMKLVGQPVQGKQKWLDPAKWTHPSLGTYRLEKQAREDRYWLWRYDFGGWQYVRTEDEPRLATMAYLGEDDTFTYWKGK